MDWNRQTQELIRQWSDAQQKVWDTWAQSFGGAPRSPGEEAWQRAIALWQESVTNTLDAQSRWLDNWIDSIGKNESTPEDVRRQLEQGREMMHQWMKAQRELMDSWFSGLKQASPGAQSWDSQVQQMMSTLNDAANRAMAVQREWAERLGGGGKPGG